MAATTLHGGRRAEADGEAFEIARIEHLEFSGPAVQARSSEMLPGVRFENVLMPLDGSEFARAALPTARALAERFDATLRTISVVREEGDLGRFTAFGRSAIGADLTDDRAVAVIGDDPASAIVDHAEELGSCLVCLSTHARRQLTGTVFGSVARSVIEQSGPVIALGPFADRPGWSPPPRSWPAPLSSSRLVACVDGSEESERILPTASAWARALGMTLAILAIAEDVPEPMRVTSRPSSRPSDYVRELARHWQTAGHRVIGEVASDPIGAGGGLRHYLARYPASLIAVSARSRHARQRGLHAATARQIVRPSIAPCLVVPT